MMRTLTGLIAVLCLAGAAATVPLLGAVLFAFVLFGLFLLALVAVLSGVEERTVEQHDPALDPSGWRRGL
jgi:hypothetical protein